VVQRAREEDLNRPIAYEVAFVRNGAGRVVTDVRRHPSNPLHGPAWDRLELLSRPSSCAVLHREPHFA